jgi:hypothetical protein
MRWLLLVLVLVACSNDRPSDAARAQRRSEREAKAAAFVTQPPTSREHAMGTGSLLVVEVPVTDGYGSTERQQCFVWRDSAFKTANITCPSREVVITP